MDFVMSGYLLLLLSFEGTKSFMLIACFVSLFRQLLIIVNARLRESSRTCLPPSLVPSTKALAWSI